MHERYLSPEERAEYAILVDEVLNGDRTVDDAKVRRYQELLLDAAQAQRAWANFVLDQSQLTGLRKDLIDRAKREAVALVNYQGHAVGKTLRVGRRRRDDDGRMSFQQALIHDFTWDELRAWLDMIEGQIAGLLVNRHIARRLLELHARFPESRGPGEACGQLGITVEQYLGGMDEAA